MAKINRFNGNLVAPASAALGTERTIFGEVTQSDDLTDQFTADLLRGWGIVGPSDEPTLQDFNAMGFTLGQLHAYLHQMGVAEYNATQEYHLGSVANVAGVLYISLVDTNIGNDPTSSPNQWFPISVGGRVVFGSPGVTNWPVPLAMQLGLIKPKVSVVGGGGGASRGSASVTGNAGGGGGYTSDIIDLTGVTSVTVTVGAAGVGKDVSGAGNGTAGGTSSFGAFLSATGGAGGINGGTRVTGGSGTGGTINTDGEYGATGAGAAKGGSSALAPGGAAGDITATAAFSGRPGSFPGGGGSGGNPFSTPGAGAGGNGAAGAVIIEW